MGGLYHFARLVKKYSRYSAAVTIKEGRNEVVVSAVVLGEREDLEPRPGGMESRVGRELVCCKRLGELFVRKVPLQSLRVEVDEVRYAVMEERSYEGFADLYVYRIHKLQEERAGDEE